MNYNGDEYFYIKNLQGDIIEIVDASGNTVARYRYDAWGNNIIDPWDSGLGIADINPYRYRSYRYDSETGLYYLNARYYDSSIGRFISADSINYLDPSSEQGLNLYAYGNNNPVMMIDPNGNFAWLIFAAIILFTPVGGTALQIAASTLSYVGMVVASIWDREIREDMNAIGWNPFNTNESSTLSSNKVSFYKGVPVFRFSFGERSGSFGAIFLTKDSGIDTLRHERGHNWQLMMMGIGTYGLMIGLPSAFEWSTRSYYERPWEITADVFGDVRGRTHTQSDINRGYWYLGVSSFFGPVGYFFLFGEY
jgi:RHS repeat-associated protein